MKNNFQILFLSHGGGPMPLLGDEGHIELVAGLKRVATDLRKPSAIIVVSAHWEETIASITSEANPSLIYDYYGFPEESYQITYPCSGEPELAQQVSMVLLQKGIESRLDQSRGFDHGLFIPLKLMYPDADIPCIQLSLLHSLDAQAHLELGAALAELDYENLLVIGSGFTFHNMKQFFSNDRVEAQKLNQAFENWLIETCSSRELTEAERMHRLLKWELAPAARFCHPREEHLLPLHVCYGMAQAACTKVYAMNVFHYRASIYLWQ